jgi:hypothetical protein
MIPEKVFQQILALGEAWRVVRMDYQEKESKVLIRVEETPAVWPPESCPHCGHKTVRGYDHAPERRLCAPCRVGNVKAAGRFTRCERRGRDGAGG